jgi:peptidylprolyl isomerase
VPTNKQRRDTARRHLERQLQRRQEREARRRRVTLISSVAATLVLIAVIIVGFVVFGGGSDKNPKINAGGKKPTTSTSTSPSPTPTPSTSYPPAKGKAVTFKGVTVKGATDLKGYPVVTSKGSGDPKAVEVKDLVVGKGKAATPTSSVNVQYYGVLYKNGQYFDSSWKRGMPADFPLTGVIKGFTYGIGGDKAGKIAPMKVGGRRIIIVPSALGYGPQGSGSTIPPNSPLVFVVDLKNITG